MALDTLAPVLLVLYQHQTSADIVHVCIWLVGDWCGCKAVSGSWMAIQSCGWLWFLGHAFEAWLSWRWYRQYSIDQAVQVMWSQESVTCNFKSVPFFETGSHRQFSIYPPSFPQLSRPVASCTKSFDALSANHVAATGSSIPATKVCRHMGAGR